MAGYGPPPDENRRRTNADTFEEAAVVVPSEEEIDVPKLPGASKYLQETRDWYADWCRSPQVGAFLPTDWRRLFQVAKLVDKFNRHPDTKTLSEIRLNESLLGATHVDRVRGRIKVADAGSSAPAVSDAGAPDNVTSIDSRRERLLAGDA